MTDPIDVLKIATAASIIQTLGKEYAGVDPQIRPSANTEFGDYQANFAMSLAKSMGKAPRAIAESVAGAINHPSVESAVTAGPGFINYRLSANFLTELLASLESDPRAGVKNAEKPDTVVIDYSAPNVAKEMHVGHLRSTIIGDALARILGFLGHAVVRVNHLGDWGTAFGMLIEHLVDLGWKHDAAGSISDLNALYKAAKAVFDADPAFADRSRARVVALQSGDEATLAYWHILIDESMRHFDSAYKTLGVLLTPEDYFGESFYNAMLQPLAEELLASGAACESKGAVCLFPPGFAGQDGEPIPLIMRKSDGGFGYDATDLASIRYRVRELGGSRLIYITDARQKQHFAMLFAGARAASLIPADTVTEHAAHGSVLGEDGKPFQTRSGETVKLSDLLEEALKRAREVVESKNPQFEPEERAAIARAIGIGAVKYSDLSNDRIKDYIFSFARMLSFEGNTAPYLQNAYVRIRSISRKAGDLKPGSIMARVPEERTLALKLLQFGDAVEAVARHLEPHRLCNYLYELASSYHHFYERCPVLNADDDATKSSRLALSLLAARTLKLGLGLLGIDVVERM